MTRQGRRRLYIIGAVLLVAALVGGRWLAVETAERAWDRTFAGGEAVVQARDLARLLQALVLVICITWITGNLLIVYRAIGSVQMPRRLGDLEIVEAIPQRTLLGVTVLLGVVIGTLFALGTGDWWRHAVLAASPPHFGVSDGTLARDAGYYVSVLPWIAVIQNRALVLAIGALGIVTLLYAVIGTFRIRRGRIQASDYARAHLGFLLACVAIVIAWGAVLDPAELIAGFHGDVDQAALAVRIPGARLIGAIAVVTAVISLAWALSDRPTLIIAGWAALLIAVTAGYVVIPGVVRTSARPAAAQPGGETAELVRRRDSLERIAFGLTELDQRMPPAFPTGEAAVRAIPLWDRAHVAAAVKVPPFAVALRPARGDDTGAAWLIAPVPNATATTSPVRLALERDSGLALTALPSRDGSVLFGPGAEGPVITEDSISGIPIVGTWRRFAIAWTIQSWGLVRGDSSGRRLIWRRDVADRLERLAPFARFSVPFPAMRDGSLWWVSWGYVSHAAFPLVRPLTWQGDDVRYVRAGLLGAVRAATGETHLWLTPGYDSLTASWARRFAPLIEPADRLPADLRAQLAYPGDMFRISAQQLIRASADSMAVANAVAAERGVARVATGEEEAGGWFMRPRQPYELGGPLGEMWTGVALESGVLAPKRLAGLLAGAITPRGPVMHLWRPPASERLPGELVGSTTLRPGQLRVWPVGSSLITVQAQLFDPLGGSAAAVPRVAEVYVTLGSRSGRGLTARAALRGGEQIVSDTTLGARWERARRLAARADSALGVGDLELFGRLWRALMSELAPVQRPR